MGRLFFPVVLVLLMAGCSVDNGGNGGFEPKEPAAQSRTKYRTFISDEELKTQKELALIEANKSVELEKISSAAKLKQLELQKRAELELLREKERLLKIEHEQALERYTLLGGIMLLLLRIAEKILDTVASKDLSSEQRAKLIEALHGSAPTTKFLALTTAPFFITLIISIIFLCRKCAERIGTVCERVSDHLRHSG